MGAVPLTHGGDLAAGRRQFPNAPEPLIDLSTGINPDSYPLPSLPPDSFSRLPPEPALRRLAAAAARAYGAPSPDCVVLAPGTQILLPLVAALVLPGRARVLGPTYAEHVRVATLVGHEAEEVTDLTDLAQADLAVVVNPNNPDGRIVGKQELLDVAEGQKHRGGVLVIDEAFMDVAPADSSLSGAVDHGNLVVLRSFGKFFGLAGLRLGFALAAPETAARLSASLGPWPVSGPAIVIGEAALTDPAWARAARVSLHRRAQELDALLTGAKLHVVGGTTLFRLVRSTAADELFRHLGRAGILVRRYAERPEWLRFGIPHIEQEWQRLRAALSALA
jgi:cobalamin biosynthetic protein CobC